MQKLLFLQSETTDPYASYAAQLAQSPLHYDSDAGLWAVYSHAGCKAILEADGAHIPAAALDGLQGKAAQLGRGLVRLANPPAHAQLRRIALRLFERLQAPDVAALLEGLLEGGGRELDWVDAVCKRLPALALMHGLAFSAPAVIHLAPRVERLAKLMLPSKPAPLQEDLRQVAEECWPHLQAEAARLTGAQDDDAAANLAGLLIQSLDAGRGLLSNALPHALALPTLPATADAWRLLVIETLRFDSPIQNTRRVLAREMEVEGRRLRAGDAVLLVLAAANRDPAQFARPQRFDVCRPNNGEHLSFGSGAHACVAREFAVRLAAEALRALCAGRGLRLLQQRIAYEPLLNARLPVEIRIRME